MTGAMSAALAGETPSAQVAAQAGQNNCEKGVHCGFLLRDEAKLDRVVYRLERPLHERARHFQTASRDRRLYPSPRYSGERLGEGLARLMLVRRTVFGCSRAFAFFVAHALGAPHPFSFARRRPSPSPVLSPEYRGEGVAHLPDYRKASTPSRQTPIAVVDRGSAGASPSQLSPRRGAVGGCTVGHYAGRASWRASLIVRAAAGRRMRTLRQTIAVAVLFPLCACLSGGCTPYERLSLENDRKMTGVLTLSQDELQSLTAAANDRGEGVTIDLSDGVSPDEAAVVAVVASPSLHGAEQAAGGVGAARSGRAAAQPAAYSQR